MIRPIGECDVCGWSTHDARLLNSRCAQVELDQACTGIISAVAAQEAELPRKIEASWTEAEPLAVGK